MDFSNTTTRQGIIQEIERITLQGAGAISGNTEKLKDFTARTNNALDQFYSIALTHDGNWQYDDPNYTTIPIGVGDLVSGQQDYSFASDVLMIEKVLVKDSSGNWLELTPVDSSQSRTDSYARNIWELPSGNSGIPTRYDKFANSILLDPIPNYNSTGGLKVVFKRVASYFVYTDTTKDPGVPQIFHPYIARVAALPYLLEHSMDNAGNINNLILQDEERIKEFMSKRNKDDVRVLRPKGQGRSKK